VRQPADRRHPLTPRAGQRASAFALGLFGTVVASVCASPGFAAQAGQASSRPGDELLVVDCLLPGQIRNLGQRSTYVSARRPAKLTARECQIRGGEYAAYDRASLQTSLEVWLPAARDGDAAASTIVGELFERGVGSTPDYGAAAEWYRRAAATGSTRAQINLGHLYEKGLGVARDPREALKWYRRAAGLEAGIELDPGPDPVAVDNQRLRGELAQLRRDASTLSAALERARRELEAALQQPPPPQSTPPSPPPETAPEIRNQLEALRQQLLAGAGDIATLNRLLGESRERLGESQAELTRARADHAARLEELKQARAAIDVQRREASEGTARLAALAEALGEREVQVERQRQDAERLRTEMTRLQAQADRQSAQLDDFLEPERVTVAAAMAGPQISIIDPQLLGTRGVTIVATTLASAATREIIGRVTAPAGLLTLAVNDQRVVANEHGVFSAPIAVGEPETVVNVVAVDRQGKRASVDFALRTRAPAAAAAAPAPARREVPGVAFGRYHALIIGNNDYQHLPDLRTAVNDAQSIAAVLGGRYGFRTRVLTNANRYAILSALNEMREQLTSEDNLLVYYAGHGMLDDVNARGHWLPVDAEAQSSANWIPTTAVTDMLNIMKARQVLVIADSCYAGALTRSSVARLATATTDQEREHWLRAVVGKRARVVLTSGGLAPVLDSGGGDHSVFASALLEVLDGNSDLLDGQRLFREVAARVSYAAGNIGFDQVPEYAPIRHAGHEAGEFFFVPKP
jgi:uncharacterized caspase-like protein